MKDEDVRRVLLAYLVAGGHHVIEELGLDQGRCRIDVAVVSPSSLAGFEIKSDKDTLARLGRQQHLYSKVLDRITLVAGSKHLAKAIDAVPDWWGVVEARMEADGSLSLHGVRDGGWNEQIDPLVLANLLWRDEMWDALAKRCLGYGLSKAPRRALAKLLAKSVPLDELRELVRLTLTTREGWRQPKPAGRPQRPAPDLKTSATRSGKSSRRSSGRSSGRGRSRGNSRR